MAGDCPGGQQTETRKLIMKHSSASVKKIIEVGVLACAIIIVWCLFSLPTVFYVISRSSVQVSSLVSLHVDLRTQMQLVLLGLSSNHHCISVHMDLVNVHVRTVVCSSLGTLLVKERAKSLHKDKPLHHKHTINLGVVGFTVYVGTTFVLLFPTECSK